MSEIMMFIGVGVLGGVARACYGLLKAITKGKSINIG
mgnify:FL=1